MGKDWDRGRRQRGYDDADEYTPPASYQSRTQQTSTTGPSGPTIDAVVKFYNAEKGFGFVELSDGSGDVFLHVSALQSAGHDTVAPGWKMRVQVGQGAKGRQVTGIAEVQEAAAPPASPQGTRDRPHRATRRESEDNGPATTVAGTVKWYAPEKGFGFVVADDGLKDVFVHVSVVEKAGMSQLTEGQRLSMQVVTKPKGREAISVAAPT